MLQYRHDCDLAVKFRFSDCVPIVGDMVAIFDADELARTGGNLSFPKAVAMVPLEGYFGYQSVTFKRKT